MATNVERMRATSSLYCRPLTVKVESLPRRVLHSTVKPPLNGPDAHPRIPLKDLSLQWESYHKGKGVKHEKV